MHIRMHNNNFDILFRSVHYSAKLQLAKLYENPNKIKCYLYNTSAVFAFSYKLYSAQNLQLHVLCFGTVQPNSPY